MNAPKAAEGAALDLNVHDDRPKWARPANPDENVFGPGTLQRPGQFIVIVKQAFLRECLARTLAVATGAQVESYASVDTYLAQSEHSQAALVLLSIVGLSNEEAIGSLTTLSAAAAGVPTTVLIDEEDISHLLETPVPKSRGYVLASMEFDVAVEIMHLVRSGGSYVPIECAETHVRRRMTRERITPLVQRDDEYTSGLREPVSAKTGGYGPQQGAANAWIRDVAKNARLRNRAPDRGNADG